MLTAGCDVAEQMDITHVLCQALAMTNLSGVWHAAGVLADAVLVLVHRFGSSGMVIGMTGTIGNMGCTGGWCEVTT